MNSKFLKEQLDKIAKDGIEFDVDGVNADSIPDTFDTITFHKNNNEAICKVTFSEYIVHPFEGFDLHDKWNNGIAPIQSTMYGDVIEETEKMYHLKVYDEQFENVWLGWCPKKSCVVTWI